MSTKANHACAAQQIHVNDADLPLSCPMPDQAVWNAHPKVYLPIKDRGQMDCPYCGTTYIYRKGGSTKK